MSESIIENKGIEYLKKIILESGSISDILRSYGLSPVGSGSRRVLKRLLEKWNITIVFEYKKRKINRKNTPFEEVFIEKSTF